MTADTVDWEALRRAAEEARANAYAPYSGFPVGVALLAEDGRVFTGVNVENASYGVSLCAERNAIAAAVGSGAKTFKAIVIIAPGPDAVPPCGMCRQVMAEFPPSFGVRSYTPEGKHIASSAEALFPTPFNKGHLGS